MKKDIVGNIDHQHTDTHQDSTYLWDVRENKLPDTGQEALKTWQSIATMDQVLSSMNK